MPAATASFLLRFLRPRQDPARERETVFDVAGETREATLFLPPATGGTHPAWIVLPGVTVPGRHHEGVRRMARALATAGQLALVPEVPSWTELRVRPRDAEPTVRAALAAVRRLPAVDGRRVGVMAFSVAATWALEAAAGELGCELRAVVGMGAYADFRRLVRAMVVGEHAWCGRRYRYAPDPYGRWIVGADLLPRLDGDVYGTAEEREVAARALHQLARAAGRNGALASLPVYDRLIADLRAGIPAGARAAWDVLASPSHQPVPDPERGRGLADALAGAGLRVYPELDAAGHLDGLRTPTILLHGRGDTLIPFTETLRLASLLPRGTRRRVTVTRLVGHAKTTGAGPPSNPAALAGEVAAFVRTIASIVGSLER